MSFTVFIEKGLHAGAVQRLAPGIYTIGSELDADIVLSDADVLPIHAILEIDGTGLRLEPAKGTISIDGETGRLEPGDERHLALPATFHIGDATISVRAPKDAVRNKNRQRLMIGAIAASFLVIVGLTIVGQITGSFSSGADAFDRQARSLDTDPTPLAPTEQAAADMDMTSEGAVLEGASATLAAAASDPEPVLSVDEAAAELRGKLVAADLDGIDVIVRKDHLAARGTLDSEKLTDWQNVQIWFDGAYGHRIPLMTAVDASEKLEPPKLAIEAIWTGDKPYLMAGSRRYVEGADIGNGWTIDQIDAEQIILRQGDRTFAITL